MPEERIILFTVPNVGQVAEPSQKNTFFRTWRLLTSWLKKWETSLFSNNEDSSNPPIWSVLNTQNFKTLGSSETAFRLFSRRIQWTVHKIIYLRYKQVKQLDTFVCDSKKCREGEFHEGYLDSRRGLWMDGSPGTQPIAARSQSDAPCARAASWYHVSTGTRQTATESRSRQNSLRGGDPGKQTLLVVYTCNYIRKTVHFCCPNILATLDHDAGHKWPIKDKLKLVDWPRMCWTIQDLKHHLPVNSKKDYQVNYV